VALRPHAQQAACPTPRTTPGQWSPRGGAWCRCAETSLMSADTGPWTSALCCRSESMLRVSLRRSGGNGTRLAMSSSLQSSSSILPSTLLLSIVLTSAGISCSRSQMPTCCTFHFRGSRGSRAYVLLEPGPSAAMRVLLSAASDDAAAPIRSAANQKFQVVPLTHGIFKGNSNGRRRRRASAETTLEAALSPLESAPARRRARADAEKGCEGGQGCKGQGKGKG
jgi:hypothetical protein